LQARYPQVYKEHYQSSKSKSISDVFNIQVNAFGEVDNIVPKTQLCRLHQILEQEGVTAAESVRVESQIPYSENCFNCNKSNENSRAGGATGKLRSSQPNSNNNNNNNNSSSQNNQAQQADEEEEEEIARYKENFAKITRIKRDIYSHLPIYVDVKPENLQKNALDYVVEHKKKQVWTVAEIKSFLMVISDGPKYVWQAY
jgi:hypothetical protein